MQIIYTDYGGAHSTQVAAALHLGILSRDKTPSAEELMALPLFDRITKEHHGCLIYMGRDEGNNDIYILGRGKGEKIVERAIACGAALTPGAGQIMKIRFFCTLSCVNLWMRIGGYLSRSLGWVSLGRPLVIFGTRRAFPQLVELVDEARRRVAAAPDTPFLLGSDNEDLLAKTGITATGLSERLPAP